MYKSYANALDELLHLFVNESEGFVTQKLPLDSRKQEERVMALLQQIRDKYKFSYAESLSIFNQLSDDKFTENIPSTSIVRITFKGRDFIKQGGYTKELKDKNKNTFINSATSYFLIAGAVATIVIAYIEAYRFVEKTTQFDKKGTSLNQQILRNSDTLSQSKTLLKK